MTRTRTAFALLLALASSRLAVAQVPAPVLPTGVDVLVLPLTGDPTMIAPIAIRSTPISATVNCNLPLSPAPPLPLINPGAAEFDDPFTPGKKCRVPLPALVPNGDYRGVVVLTAPGACPLTPCVSGRSGVGVPNFTLAGAPLPPAVATGLGFKP